jgi:acyl transferase domain-containing protein
MILSPDVSISESNMFFLSPDSQCKTFTSGANGYGRGEGVVVLILKRVTDALADGDVIRGVIRGSGSNQDGRTPGIGRPSVEAQQNLISRVYQDAGLDLATTRYFEAHGTGTAVGDPIETKAIGRVFRTSRSPSEPLYM